MYTIMQTLTEALIPAWQRGFVFVEVVNPLTGFVCEVRDILQRVSGWIRQ